MSLLTSSAALPRQFPAALAAIDVPRHVDVPVMRIIANRRCAQLGLAPVIPETENPFPWVSEVMDLKNGKNFFETRVIEYQDGGALARD